MKIRTSFRVTSLATIIGAMLAGTLPCSHGAGSPTNDLAAYYSFNGNANDESGNGKHGVNIGATFVADRFGVANRACAFDGNGFISLDTNRPITGLRSNFSISVWFRANNTAGGDLYVHRAGFRDVGLNWSRGTPAVPGGVNWNMWDSGGTPHEIVSTALPTNEWIQCVGTFNGSTQALYTNGVLSKRCSGLAWWTGMPTLLQRALVVCPKAQSARHICLMAT